MLYTQLWQLWLMFLMFHFFIFTVTAYSDAVCHYVSCEGSYSRLGIGQAAYWRKNCIVRRLTTDHGTSLRNFRAMCRNLSTSFFGNSDTGDLHLFLVFPWKTGKNMPAWPAEYERPRPSLPFGFPGFSVFCVYVGDS